MIYHGNPWQPVATCCPWQPVATRGHQSLVALPTRAPTTCGPNMVYYGLISMVYYPWFIIHGLINNNKKGLKNHFYQKRRFLSSWENMLFMVIFKMYSRRRPLPGNLGFLGIRKIRKFSKFESPKSKKY